MVLNSLVTGVEDGHFRVSPSREKAIANSQLNIHDLFEHNDKVEQIEYAYKLWNSQLFNYIRRSMSDPLDKLVAIAGFASLLQGILQCRYMYGLWENDLIRGLSWTTPRTYFVNKAKTPNSTKSKLRELNSVPSWSWASVDGPVSITSNPDALKLLRDPENLRLEILENDNVSHSFDPVRSDASIPEAFALHVRGFLGRLWHVPILSGITNKGFLMFEHQTPFDIEGFINFDKKGEPRNYCIALGSWDTYEDYEERTYWGRLVYSLLLTYRAGLLLTHVKGKYYQRVGHFWKWKRSC